MTTLVEKIPFNKPAFSGREFDYIREAIETEGHLSGEGRFTHLVQDWFVGALGCSASYLTPSGTAALEMAAILADIGPGDEVIMPSYTFVSTANAFALRAARIVFVDVEPRTMNVDPECIAAAVTPQTKAIVPVHYAGVSCDMDRIDAIAAQHGLTVIEDAAHAVKASYHGTPVGSRGNMACFSFHETKNYTCGEGGLLTINDEALRTRAEIVRDKGTNRRQFFRGQVDKYTWVDLGSSYLASDLQAAYLYAQLEASDAMLAERLAAWDAYRVGLLPLARRGRIELPYIPPDCEHNAHCFYVKCKDLEERTLLTQHLGARGISAVFHYVPLHTSPAGRRHGRFHGADRHTTREGERLLRLPLWHGIGERVHRVVEAVLGFYA